MWTQITLLTATRRLDLAAQKLKGFVAKYQLSNALGKGFFHRSKICPTFLCKPGLSATNSLHVRFTATWAGAQGDGH